MTKIVEGARRIDLPERKEDWQIVWESNHVQTFTKQVSTCMQNSIMPPSVMQVPTCS